MSAEPDMRKPAEIRAAENEMYERVWYDRSKTLDHEKTEAAALAKIMAKYEELEAKYGKESLGAMSDFDWGMLNGKLSALRRVLGDEWDNLDT